MAASLFLPGAANAYPAGPVPAFVQPLPVPLDSLPPPDQASTGVYWLLLDVQEDIPSQRTYGHYATKILGEAGLQQASQISVDFDPTYQKLRFHRITLWRKGRPSELLPGLKPTSMRRERGWEWGLLDGRQTQLFSLEDVRVGDVVEYSYTLQGENPIFKGKASGLQFFQFTVPIERIAFRLLHSPERRVHLVPRNHAPEPRIGSLGDRRELSWDISRVPALIQDSDAPGWHNPFPRVQWSEFRTWAEVVAWAVDVYQVKGTLSPELEKVAARLEKLSPRDRIRHALRLVQDDIRYLGLEMGSSSHHPTHPNKVFARRFGDCKDKSLLFCTLMGRLGVEAVPVLVNSHALRDVEEIQPSPLAFDHVIARVELEGAKYWFDPTMGQQRGDPLNTQELDYGNGLPIVRGGSGFDDIRPDPDGAGRMMLNQDFNVTSLDSTATFKITSVFTGGEANAIRSLFASDSREEIAQSYLNYYARVYPEITVAEPFLIEDDTATNVVTVRESYWVDSLCASDDGRKGCNLYPQEIAHWVSEPGRRIRTSPYSLAFPKNVEQNVILRLPGEIAFPADKGSVEHPDFEFSWSETVSGRIVQLRYQYKSRSDHVPLDRFPSYLAVLDTVGDNLGATLYQESGISGGFENPNWFLILFTAMSIGAGLWLIGRLRRLDPPRRDLLGDPQPIGGWLLLLALGVVLQPLVQLYYLSEMGYLFDQGAWNALTVKGSPGYHPFWAPLLLSVLFGSVVLACGCFYLWHLFFKRNRRFPKAYVILSLMSLFFVTVETFGLEAIPASMRDMEKWSGFGEWLGEAVLSAIWIAYVLRSFRVSETFVFPRPPDAMAEARVAEAAGDAPGSERG